MLQRKPNISVFHTLFQLLSSQYLFFRYSWFKCGEENGKSKIERRKPIERRTEKDKKTDTEREKQRNTYADRERKWKAKKDRDKHRKTEKYRICDHIKRLLLYCTMIAASCDPGKCYHSVYMIWETKSHLAHYLHTVMYVFFAFYSSVTYFMFKCIQLLL